MSQDGLLEPSFADAIAAIEQASELPPSRADALGLFASPDRQGARATAREHRRPLGRGGLEGQPAPSHQ